GLTGMYDPPRPEVKDAVAQCHAAGIRVVMITGDHPRTAMAIARALGIAADEDVALSGAELDQLSDEELRQRAPKVAVYARVTADPIDPDVMKQRPRARHERITDGSFLSTMFLTGILTAGVSFAVYFYGLRSETPELARTHAFAALVFAELLRSFGGRSETRP